MAEVQQLVYAVSENDRLPLCILGSGVGGMSFLCRSAVGLFLDRLMSKYSSPAYRSFKTFIGELTAAAAGIIVGIHEAIPVIEECEDSDPWKIAAERHDIVVHGLSSRGVVDSSVRLSLVSLYSGFDLFMIDVRRSFLRIQGREWVQYDGDAPFTALKRNVRVEASEIIDRLGAHRVAAMDHYRLVRNAVAHPSPEARGTSKGFFDDNAELLREVRSQYGARSGPNGIDGLTFHDIKLLSRVALDVTKAIDELLDPGDQRFRELLAHRPIDRAQSRVRNHNALTNWLKTEYGLSPDRAARIVEPHLTQELDG